MSVSDEERARTAVQTTAAAAEAEARKLELARNKLKYTVLRASRSGVVTAVRFEAGQVVAEGLPVVSIAAEGEPEIVVDVPEDHLAAFRKAQVQGDAGKRAGRVVRRGAARTGAAGRRTDAHLPGAAEAHLRAAPAARRHGDPRRRTRDGAPRPWPPSRPRPSPRPAASRPCGSVRRQADAHRHGGTRAGDRARLPQRRSAAVRPARRRADRDRRRAEDGAGPARGSACRGLHRAASAAAANSEVAAR